MSLWSELQALQEKYAALQTQDDALHKQMAAVKADIDRLEGSVQLGVDVSQFQGDIDWAQVKKAGYRFAFVRVSDGDLADTLCSTARLKAVRGAGLKLGVYHYARPATAANGQRDGGIECAMAVYGAWKAGALRAGDLPMVYDFENEALQGLDPKSCATHLMRWVRSYNVLRGHRPIVYVNRAAVDVVLPHLSDGDQTFLASCPLWLADPDAKEPRTPTPWKEPTFWQFSWKGVVAGVSTPPVDLDRFFGTTDDLGALCIK